MVISGGPSQKNIDDQNPTGVLYSHSMGKPNTDLDIFRNITAFCQRETDESKLPKLIDDAIKAALVNETPGVPGGSEGSVQSAQLATRRSNLDTSAPAGAAGAVATAVLQDLKTASTPSWSSARRWQRYGLAAKVLAVLDRLQLRWATTVVASRSARTDSAFIGCLTRQSARRAELRDHAGGRDRRARCSVRVRGTPNLMIPKIDKTIRVWDGNAVIRNGAPQTVGLPALVDELESQSVGANPVTYDTPMTAVADPQPVAAAAELGYQQVVDVVAEPAFLDASFTVIADTFLGIYPAARMKMPAQDSFMACALWASIGHSVGAAVGAWKPGGKRPLVLIGDGGFQMVGQAVSTMVRYQHDAIVVIIDNSLYGFEQSLLGPG